MRLRLPLLLLVLVAGCAVRSTSSQLVPASARLNEQRVLIASNGWQLVADLILPAAGAGPAPAALLLSKANGTRAANQELARLLALRGIGSLRIDLRGHGESTNLGRFIPFAPGAVELLEGSELDIVAALGYLRTVPGIDPKRIAIVGASYTGELSVMAGRITSPPAVTALLSPGSLSAESISRLDSLGARWLFVASRVERNESTRKVIAMVMAGARQADIILLAAPGHGTNLLAMAPGFDRQLADWLATQMTPSFLDDAVRVGRWLETQSALTRGAIPDAIGEDGPPSISIGTGAAGRLLFFLELYAATGDPTFLASAKLEGEVVARAPTDSMPAGLYDGSAGTGFALAELSRMSGDPRWLDRSRGQFAALLRRATLVDGGAIWNGSNDVLAGTAGIGMALIAAARQFGDSSYLTMARAAGAVLLRNADSVSSGLRWRRFVERDLDLPNFSHGTAGVATFLAMLGRETGDSTFIRAAIAGAAYLEAIADRTGGLYLVPYGVPNQGYVTRFDIGWAHGPAGTSRLFSLLAGMTGDLAYRDRVIAGARTVLASGVPGPTNDSTRWAGPFALDRRFGLAGVIPFLIESFRESGEGAYLDLARRLGEEIRRTGQGGPTGLYWSLPRYAFQDGEGNLVSTGYFHGAAGLGAALLDLHYALRGERARIQLPDDPSNR